MRNSIFFLFCYSIVTSKCLGFTSKGGRGPRVPCVQRSFQDKKQEIAFDPNTILDDSEDVPDDVPKDVSTEKLIAAMSKEKTLYEILNARPTAERAELKQRYVELAKISHPDARIGKKEVDEEVPDFGEIAAAWRVLGDSRTRKRYDRDLRAKEFAETAQRFANERLEKAVPAVAAMLDKVAVPFLRRTKATTWAVGQAVAKGVSNISQTASDRNNSRLTDAFVEAIAAGKQAGRVIDSIELNEKSLELEERAKKEQEKSDQINQELSSVTEKRLFATLQSSSFALSSDEAKEVLNRLHIEDTVSIVDRAMLKNTIEKDIKCLEEAEITFSEKLEQYEVTDSEWNELLKEQESARDEVELRKKQEIEARKALERAQRMVAEVKAHLVMTSNALRGVEQKVRKNAFEMDRVTTNLSKKQDKVRHVLRKKADMINGGIKVEYLSEEDLASLRRKEIQLRGESRQVARMVARLQSRSEKLKIRAEALEKYQKSGQNV